MKELLTKKYAGLPGWAWLGIGVAGVALGLFLMHFQKGKSGSAAPADLTATTAPDLETGNTGGAESNPASGSVGDNGIINNPFPETSVSGNQIPIIPPGYQAVYDENGNIIAFEPVPPGNTGTGSAPAPTPTPTPISSIITYVTTKAGASLETTPHDSNGGKNILTLPLGAVLTYVSGPVPDPTGQNKSYYLVKYQNFTGYVGSDVIQQQSVSGPPKSPILPLAASTPQTLAPAKR